MALTYTFIEDTQAGAWAFRAYNIKLDTSYPTGGYSVAANKVRLKTIIGVEIWGWNAAGSGIVQILPDYSASGIGASVKLMAFRVATFTPAGTIGGNVTVVGGGIGEAIGINPDSNAGVLSKAAATNRTIPIATFLGAAPTITGTAQGQVAFAEVSNAVNLAAVTVRLVFIGR